jgi:polysaccharide deacetylase family protein (PEP-CTERM system associated)
MNILTIDLEDWFHILAHDETSHPGQWEKFESRVGRNTEWILEKLALHQHSATFFCLGWIALKFPSLIKMIVKQGHEIASHSMNHQLVYEQTPQEFRSDLQMSLRLLEDLTGEKVKTYRAPGFSLTENSKWVFDILIENGIEVDCSIFPARRNHGGYPDFSSRRPCLVSINGKTIKEFPMSLAGRLPFSGGGYFRVLPYPIIRSLMKKSEYVMTYFHPRDFDPDQAVIPSLSLKRRFMSYAGLGSSKRKWELLLREFRFLNVRNAVHQISWNEAAVVSLDKGFFVPLR